MIDHETFDALARANAFAVYNGISLRLNQKS